MGGWFSQILREEKCPQTKEHMLDYLIALMEDANDFSWDAARASHAVLLCRMEQGEVKNYCDTDKLDRIRRANAQRHVTTSSTEVQNSQKKLKIIGLSLAPTSIRAHVCTKGPTIPKVPPTDCFQQTGKTYPHAEQNCRNKNTKKSMSKNE